LDSNRTLISDIYSEVRALDGNWSETINEGEYVRVVFEQELDSTRDMAIYVRGTGSVEVYEVSQDVLLATFVGIGDGGYSRILLTNLNGTQDTFDLKVVGGDVEFDYIKDACTDADGDGFGIEGANDACTYPGVVDCVDTNSSIVPAVMGYDVNRSLYICPGTYYLNATEAGGIGGYGALNFNANDIFIDCNGSTFIGNTTDGIVSQSIGIGTRSLLTNVDHNNTEIRNCTIMNYYYGLYTSPGSYNSTFEDNNLSHNSIGIGVGGMNGTFANNYFENNTGGVSPAGVFVEGNYNTILNNDFYGDTWGVFIADYGNYHPSYSVVNNNTFTNMGSGMVYLHSSDNNVISNNTLNGATIYGIALSVDAAAAAGVSHNNTISGNVIRDALEVGLYADNCSDNDFYNNTINGSERGIHIYDGAQRNSFYFNNFTSITNYYVNNELAVAAGNTFNTTDGGVAKGNYYDDILTIGIFDGDQDGYGDSGVAYPYNSSQTKWTGFGDDYGPIGASNNSLPYTNYLIINSTLGTNRSSEDITVYSNISDADGDATTPIYNWYKNNLSILALNIPFEGGSTSSYAKDYSGYGLDGSASGLGWNRTGGNNGSGYYKFNNSDLTNNHMTIPPVNISNNEMTISLWFKILDVSTSVGLICKEPYNSEWCIYLNANDLVVARGDIGLHTVSSSTLVDNEWNHLAYIVNTTDKKMYFNGVLSGNVSGTFAIPNNLVAGTNDVLLGAIHTTGPDYRNETLELDDVQVYDIVLTAAQILELNNSHFDVIKSSQIVLGENWSVCMTPNDGVGDGSINCTENLEILAGPPQATNVFVNSTTIYNYSSDDIFGHWTYYDKDGLAHSMNETKWYNNSVEIENLRNFSWVDQANFTDYDNWTFSVRANNGVYWGSWANATINLTTARLPQAINVFVNSTTSYNRSSDNIFGHWTYYDDDGLAHSMNETRWYNNSVEIENLKNLSWVDANNFTLYDNWTFSVRPHNGVSWGSWANATMNFTLGCESGYGTLDVGSGRSCANIQDCYVALNNSIDNSCSLTDSDTTYTLDANQHGVFDPQREAYQVGFIFTHSTHNITLDCNGSLINLSNSYPNSVGIQVGYAGDPPTSNITIKNCNVTGGNHGVFVWGNVKNVLIEDSSFEINESYGAGGAMSYYSLSTNNLNLTLRNSNFLNGVVRLEGQHDVRNCNFGGDSATFIGMVLDGNNTIFENNTVHNATSYLFGTFLISDSIMANNTFYGGGSYSGIFIDDGYTKNNTISGNSFFDYDRSGNPVIWFPSTAEDYLIENNYFSNGWEFINSSGLNNSIIRDNIFNTSAASCLNFGADSFNNEFINNTFEDCGNVAGGTPGFKVTTTIWNYDGTEYNSAVEWGAGMSIYLGGWPPSDIIFSTGTDYVWAIGGGSLENVVNGSTDFDLALLTDCSFQAGPTSHVVSYISDNFGATDCASLMTALGEPSNCCDYYADDIFTANGATSAYTYNDPNEPLLSLKSGFVDPPIFTYDAINTRSYPSFLISTDGNSILNNTFKNTYDLSTSYEVEISGSYNNVSGNNFLKGSYTTPINDDGAGNSFCVNNVGNFYESKRVNSPMGECGDANVTTSTSVGTSTATLGWSAQDGTYGDTYYDIYGNDSDVLTLLDTISTTSYSGIYYHSFHIIPWLNGSRYNATTTYAVFCAQDWGAWSAWSTCALSSQSRTRIDSTSCIDTGTQSCTVEEEETSTGGGSLPPVDDGGEGEEPGEDIPGDEMPEIPEECAPVWSCGDWGSCSAYYDVEDVLNDDVSVAGLETRICSDSTGCVPSYDESQTCLISVSVNVETTEEGVEFFDEDGYYIGSVSFSDILGVPGMSRMDIFFGEAVASHCKNGIVDEDEIGVDCGGEDCIPCMQPVKVSDWVFWLKLALWILFLILVTIEAYVQEWYKHESFNPRRVVTRGIRKIDTRILEKKVEGFFKRSSKSKKKVFVKKKTLKKRSSKKSFFNLFKRKKKFVIDNVKKNTSIKKSRFDMGDASFEKLVLGELDLKLKSGAKKSYSFIFSGELAKLTDALKNKFKRNLLKFKKKKRGSSGFDLNRERTRKHIRKRGI
jgi:parallel beta-helix repeat protein